jgi:hypothetical protein
MERGRGSHKKTPKEIVFYPTIHVIYLGVSDMKRGRREGSYVPEKNSPAVGL